MSCGVTAGSNKRYLSDEINTLNEVTSARIHRVLKTPVLMFGCDKLKILIAFHSEGRCGVTKY
jgi:hypothetical protein